MKFKKILRSMLPDKHTVQQHHQLRFLGRIMEDSDMFHLTRRSMAGGSATGLFFAFIPVPGQTVLAVLVAIFFRVNLPIAAALTWVTNPLTTAPLFFLAYKLGATLLGHPVHPIQFEMTWAWIEGTLMNIWPALVTGSLILATVSSIAGYFMVHLLWRMAVVQKWEKRKQTRRKVHK
jgi:uncharacterized protein